MGVRGGDHKWDKNDTIVVIAVLIFLLWFCIAAPYSLQALAEALRK